MLSRGRRAEGRRRRRRRLRRGGTDAGSGRGGESQRLPSASPERERSRSCSLAGVRGWWHRERLLGGPARSGRGGRRGGREERAVPETWSPQPFPAAAHPVNSSVLPSVPLRENKTKPKTLKMVAEKESNFAEGRAEAHRAGRLGPRWVGRGRAGSEGGVGAPGGPGHRKHPSRGRGRRWGSRALAGSRASESALRGRRSNVRGVGAWGGGFGNHQQAPVERRRGSGLHFGLRT